MKFIVVMLYILLLFENTYAENNATQFFNFFLSQNLDFGKLPSSLKSFFKKNDYTPLASYESSHFVCCKGWRKHTYHTIYDGTVEEVFMAITQTDARLAWNGNNSSFQFLFRTQEKQLLAADKLYNSGANKIDAPIYPRAGDLVFLELMFVGKLTKIPVAFKIETMELASAKNSARLSFSYVKQNLTQGVQNIYLYERLNNERKRVTGVIHETYFKSDSDFRDKVLYRHFHKIAIKNYHEKMNNRLNER